MGTGPIVTAKLEDGIGRVAVPSLEDGRELDVMFPGKLELGNGGDFDETRRELDPVPSGTLDMGTGPIVTAKLEDGIGRVAVPRLETGRALEAVPVKKLEIDPVPIGVLGNGGAFDEADNDCVLVPTDMGVPTTDDMDTVPTTLEFENVDPVPVGCGAVPNGVVSEEIARGDSEKMPPGQGAVPIVIVVIVMFGGEELIEVAFVRREDARLEGRIPVPIDTDVSTGENTKDDGGIVSVEVATEVTIVVELNTTVVGTADETEGTRPEDDVEDDKGIVAVEVSTEVTITVELNTTVVVAADEMEGMSPEDDVLSDGVTKEDDKGVVAVEFASEVAIPVELNTIVVGAADEMGGTVPEDDVLSDGATEDAMDSVEVAMEVAITVELTTIVVATVDCVSDDGVVDEVAGSDDREADDGAEEVMIPDEATEDDNGLAEGLTEGVTESVDVDTEVITEVLFTADVMTTVDCAWEDGKGTEDADTDDGEADEGEADDVPEVEDELAGVEESAGTEGVSESVVVKVATDVATTVELSTTVVATEDGEVEGFVIGGKTTEDVAIWEVAETRDPEDVDALEAGTGAAELVDGSP
ncbi:hypothetical protein LTR37_007487 [Vermiconidia calcicola]|uniref:Uncharacterized protein n=1 Tax=Vermiconidia calcicola TaxID=1690605 RepID=A0ACC3NDS8_9PEZI|nr:hypothetical protein LTR37_007487 [Vermiconidia calcicola]